jgi:hypothetical protein
VEAVHEKLFAVIGFAVEANADKNKFPDTWLFHYRWGKVAGKVL